MDILVILFSLLFGFIYINSLRKYLSLITLIPRGNPASCVAWTLSFELCFYLLLSLTFISNKIWNYCVVLWMYLIILYNYIFLSEIQFNKYSFINIFMSTYNIEFILGFLLAKLIIREVKLNIIYCSTFFAIICFLFFYFKNLHIEIFKFSINLIFALISFLLIHTSFSYFSKKFNNINVLLLIGNVTCSIYLVNNLLEMIFYIIYPKINALTGVILSLFVALTLSSCTGYFYYVIFEKKIMNWVKLKLIK